MSSVCEACGENKVRTICKECREFYCQNCSDYHLRFKATRDHTLIDLHPKYGTNPPEETNENELSSDFLENLTVTENTVLYRAQVAIEREVKTTTPSNEASLEPAGSDNSELSKESASGGRGTAKRDEHVKNKGSSNLDDPVKVGEIREFSTSLSGEKKTSCVGGILVMSKCIIIGDNNNKKLKLFDQNCDFLSSVHSSHSVFGITQVNENIFATGGLDFQVRLWTVQSNQFVAEHTSYTVDHYSYGIHFNGTYYCLLHAQDNAITVLNTKGRQIRKIVIEKALQKMVEIGFNIHMDSTSHNIYVPCIIIDTGVICFSVEGSELWFTSLEGAPGGITEIDGFLCVSDVLERCVHALSKNGQYQRKILDRNILKDKEPYNIYYDADEEKLYFSVYNTEIVWFLPIQM